MFELPDLPFSEDALGAVMSAQTLATHHGKHHAAYVNKTNALLIERGEQPASLEDVVRAAVAKKDAALFNQAAQAWNHGFFWQSLSPQNQGGPQGALAAAIEKQFGGFAKFQEQFQKQGETHFASGWIWLVAETGALALKTTPNAETPIVAVGATPLLVCDLWEHAYYLDYKNERPRFLKTVFEQALNWQFAASQFEAAQSGAPGWRYPAPSAQWAKAS